MPQSRHAELHGDTPWNRKLGYVEMARNSPKTYREIAAAVGIPYSTFTSTVARFKRGGCDD